jgi:Ras-related protein Rab-7A
MRESGIPSFKVLILGSANVGKTSILNQYVNAEFLSQYKPTIGSDYVSKQVEIDNSYVTLQIWDTAGQERYQSLAFSIYRNTQVCIFVYDITSLKTFHDVDSWHQKFMSACGSCSDRFPFLLLGNKTDESERREVPQEMGQMYAQEKNMLFYEVSAKTYSNISCAIRAVVSAAMENAKPVEETKIGRLNIDDNFGHESAKCPC